MLTIAPSTIRIVAPGFDAENQARYLDLFRLMLLTPIVFAASITLGEVLVAERHFVYYALAPILYNVGIIVGTLLFHARLGIEAAAVGAVIGSFLHLGIRLIGMTRTTVRVRFRLDLRMPALREFGKLMMPKMASHPIEPLTFLFFTSVASTLVAGSVSAVSFARNFQSVPVALIGVAISVAAFPTLSGAWAAGDRAGFSRLVRSSATTIVVVSVIAAVGLAIVGPLAIEVLLGGGAFDAEDVRLTATVLAAFALSVPFDAIGHLLSRGLYATHNTLLPLGAARGRVRRHDRAPRSPSSDRVGLVSIPLGFAAGPGRADGPAGRRARLPDADRVPVDPARRLGGPRGRLTPARRSPPAWLAVDDLRRDDRDEQPVAVRVMALGALPGQVVAAHLGGVLERARAGPTHPRSTRRSGTTGR